MDSSNIGLNRFIIALICDLTALKSVMIHYAEVSKRRGKQMVVTIKTTLCFPAGR